MDPRQKTPVVWTFGLWTHIVDGSRTYGETSHLRDVPERMYHTPQTGDIILMDAPATETWDRGPSGPMRGCEMRGCEDILL